MLRGQPGQDFTVQQPQPVEPDTDVFDINIPNPGKYKTDFANTKVANIVNLYPDTQANILWDYYYSQDENWWDTVIHPDPYFDYPERSSFEDYYHMYLTKDDDPSIPERLRYMYEANDVGPHSFTYYYKRTTNFHPYLQMLSTPKFMQLLEFITGHENLQWDPALTFVSNYSKGHYNGPHTDGINGRIAFVYHMSRNWKPIDGGLFMRMDWDYKTVNKVVVPPYNTLTIFDTSGGVSGGSPHLVSEVAQSCDNKRISFTGWYI